MSLLKDKWVWISALLGAVLAIGLSVTFVGAQAAPVKPTVTVLQAEIHVDDDIPVVGANYDPSTNILVGWKIGSQSLAYRAPIAPDGTFSTVVNLPGVPGSYDIIVLQQGKKKPVATTPIEVLP